MKVTFSEYGIVIGEENGRYYLNFDEGGIVSYFRTIEITMEEACKAQLSPQDAYEVIIGYQNREKRNKKKLSIIGRYKVEINLQNDSNNINVYDLQGNHLWNISRLLKTYSDENGIRYYSDTYYNVQQRSGNIIFCVGNINHCEIDLDKQIILKLINNR